MNRLRVVFRADASSELGIGHVMRCLTLATELRSAGHECLFISASLPGNLHAYIRARGFLVMPIAGYAGDDVHIARSPSAPDLSGVTSGRQFEIIDADQSTRLLSRERVDLLVVDHYGLARIWEHSMRPYCGAIAVFDDLADRHHDCDLLLDQNLGREVVDYDGLVPAHALVLAGPRYALIRPEFHAHRAGSIARRQTGRIEKILISMGGTDVGGITAGIVAALRHIPLPEACNVTVVLGQSATSLADVQSQVALLPCNSQILVGVEHMAQLMSESDFAIGAAGSTSYERCVLGLPTAMCILADNQRAVGEMLARAGAVATVSARESIQPDLQRIFTRLTGDPASLLEMSRQASRICDGLGTSRVMAQMKQLGSIGLV